jgi:hypothetical protein
MRTRFIIPALVLGTIATAFVLWGFPHYRVYSRRMSGQAELEQQEYTKRIMIEDARARMEAAKLLRLAEVERAHGVAEANTIIGESLQDNEAYLRYLWVQGLQDGSSEIIYVPTEANLPILEATRGR